MALFSRRRSLIFKVLLLFPTAWFLFVLIVGFSDKANNDKLIIEKKYAGVGGGEELNAIEPVAQMDRNLELRTGGQFVSTVASSSAAAVEQGAPLEEKKRQKDAERAQDTGVLVAPMSAQGPGEMGRPVILPKNLTSEQKKVVDEGWQKNAFNQYVSDMISVHRKLPDPRDPQCKESGKYLTNLPATSVIICFHNEAWSVLLRTVHSVLNRSPSSLIHDIILVDDASTMPHLKQNLDDYMAQYPKVKIVRAPQREGLIRARLMGARHASAPVLTYLDSHCECTEGWLEPLLDRIARNNTTVVCPVIDVIDDESLEYHYRNSEGVNVGGFDWNLQFNWHAIPDHEKKRREHPSDPLLHELPIDCGKPHVSQISPAKGLRLCVCVCQLNMIMIPNSRMPVLGIRAMHLHRELGSPRHELGIPNALQLVHIERRLWRCDKSEKLRERLKCKSFEWYLKNIYPELFVPGDAVASGEVRNMADDSGAMCLDSPARKQDLHKAVTLYPCHRQGGNQFWMLSKEGEIRRDEACLDYSGDDVILYPCHGSKGNQYWMYDPNSHTIKQGSSKKCLEMGPDRVKLIMSDCDLNNSRQRWSFQNYDSSKL
uniref:Polypeptide N-acetylgalactosaminyltransferase n=1 Tax=Strigamia maritima TaxID=126957 RepID=T1JB07_STRMM